MYVCMLHALHEMATPATSQYLNSEDRVLKNIGVAGGPAGQALAGPIF